MRHKLVPEANHAAIVSEQGLEMGRPSFVHIDIEHDEQQITAVFISGQCYFMGKGFIDIPS